MRNEPVKIPFTVRLIIAIAIFAAFMAMVTGCNTTKDVAKSSEATESEVVESLRKEISVYKSTVTTLENQIRELQYSTVEFDKACDTLIQFVERNGCDSSVITYLKEQLDRTKAEAEILADGTIRARGQLKSISVSKDKLQWTVFGMQAKIDSLEREVKKTETRTETRTEIKTVHKKVSYTPIWMWIVSLLSVGFNVYTLIQKAKGKITIPPVI
jgi:uncharacterized protein YlxW (UPF0749 family)